MPFMKIDRKTGKKVRDYDAELKWEKKNGKSKRAEDRKKRGRARTKMGLKDGDPREVDHKRSLSRKTNAKKEVAAKKKKAKSKRKA